MGVPHSPQKLDVSPFSLMDLPSPLSTSGDRNPESTHSAQDIRPGDVPNGPSRTTATSAVDGRRTRWRLRPTLTNAVNASLDSSRQSEASARSVDICGRAHYSITIEECPLWKRIHSSTSDTTGYRSGRTREAGLRLPDPLFESIESLR